MIAHRSCTLCDYRGGSPKCPADGSPTLPSGMINQAPSPRKRLVISERFRLLTILGRGGMGDVWFGEHTTLRQPVAIKLIRDDALDTQGARARFEREALLVSRLQHPHVVRVFDFGYEEGLGAYLVMEYLEGMDLAALIKREAPLPINLTIHLAKQVTSALCGAHKRGLVHRDLKPANIFLQDEAGVHAFVKVLDFGIAKPVEPDPEFETITRSGAVVGSPPYMAPEQAMSQALSPLTDLYALGIVIYEMLSGEKPFTGENPLEILLKHIKEEPPQLVRDDIPHVLRGLMSELLQKAPEDRPPSAEHVLNILNEMAHDIAHISTPLESWASVPKVGQDLNAATQEPTTQEQTPSSNATLPLRLKRRAGLGMAVFVSLGLGLLFWILVRPPEERNSQTPAMEKASAQLPTVRNHLDPEAPISTEYLATENLPMNDAETKPGGDTDAPPAPNISRLFLDVSPRSARVFLRSAEAGAPFELIPEDSREVSLAHGHYELKITARKKKSFRKKFEISEDKSLRIRLQSALQKPKQESLPSLPE